MEGIFTMTGKLTARSAESLAKRKGRWLDGSGLFLRTLEPGRKVYWTYRYRIGGKDREMSVGVYPVLSLAEARINHAELRALVLKGIDPVGERRKAKAPKPESDAASFGAFSDTYVERKEKRGELGKNPKHRQQWRNTLAKLPAWFRDLPVDEIKPEQVRDALEPFWTATPETGSRLRGRIAAVIESARASDDERRNPASWTPWMKTQLGSAKKLGKLDRLTGERVKRGNHAAMPYAKVPAFMARLGDAPGDAAKALMFTILTACRSGEVLGAIWNEFDLDHIEMMVGDDGRARTIAIPLFAISGDRMKAGKPHRVPLSAPALAILSEMRAGRRDDHPFVFAGARPRKPLSNMAMAMLLRQLGVGEFTVHGFRSSFRDWATEVARVEYATAERCLAHAIGSDAALSYDRSDRLVLRAPIMQSWADFVCGETGDNVIELRRAGQ